MKLVSLLLLIPLTLCLTTGCARSSASVSPSGELSSKSWALGITYQRRAVSYENVFHHDDGTTQSLTLKIEGDQDRRDSRKVWQKVLDYGIQVVTLYFSLSKMKGSE